MFVNSTVIWLDYQAGDDDDHVDDDDNDDDDDDDADDVDDATVWGSCVGNPRATATAAAATATTAAATRRMWANLSQLKVTPTKY